VIDPEVVGPEVPVLAHDLPAGAPRLVQKSAGIKATVLAGEITVERGQPTGATPGRLLRGPLAATARR
jgi:N-acyl-D-aspartate/D-glutamate deacylase